jgi:hypothetical protein
VNSGVATGAAALSIGSHTITALYGGDANFMASSSTGFTETIVGLPTLAIAVTEAIEVTDTPVLSESPPPLTIAVTEAIKVTDTPVVLIPAAMLVTIAVTPATPSITEGLTRQFAATGTYADGGTQNLSNIATWISGTPAVATITSGGLVTAVAAGTSTISATSGAVVGSTVLTVTAAVCNVSQDAAATVVDVQRMISEALGIIREPDDLNGDGVVNVSDVQIVMNAALGLGCMVG